MRADELPIRIAMSKRAEAPIDVEQVFREEGAFLWRTLHRLGVAERDLADLVQEVIVVVHRQLPSYEGRGPLRGWLYGICRKVAAAYHRSAVRRREKLVEALPDGAASDADPEGHLMRAQARQRLAAVLDELDPDKRMVFVMYEIERKRTPEIAEELAIPLGTVHSRLSSARKEFERAVRRRSVIEGRGKG